MSAEQNRARAYAARALMDDPTLQDGWNEIENDMRREWEGSLFSRRRDRIWSQLRHLRLLRQKLASFAGMARD